MLMFFTVLQIIIALILIIVVIFQTSSTSSTNLVSTSSYNSFFASKSNSNPLNKLTMIIGAFLFINSLIIGIFNYKNNNSISDLAKSLEKIDTSNNISLTPNADKTKTKKPKNKDLGNANKDIIPLVNK